MANAATQASSFPSPPSKDRSLSGDTGVNWTAVVS